MKPVFIRRHCRRKAASKSDGGFFKKGGQDFFFGATENAGFFALQRKENGDGSSSAGKTVNGYVNSLNGKGQSLSADTNHFFSSRMGYDFSNVKVHTDKTAAESANELNARAYTVDNNIVFSNGEFNTESAEGQKLIAHELAHVIQNNEGEQGMIARQPKDKPVEKKEKPKKEEKCPTLKSFEAKLTGSVGIQDTGRCEMMLGTPGKKNGITFIAKLQIPKGCAGTLQYVQLVDVCRYVKSSDGTEMDRKSGGYVLDKQDPYHEEAATEGSVEFKSDDSPGQPLGGIHVAAKDNFKVWLLWKPAGENAARIPLSVASWKWGGQADAKKLSDTDCKKKMALSKQYASGGKGVATSDLPTWSKVMPQDVPVGKGGPC